jgi:hypothetical protein
MVKRKLSTIGLCKLTMLWRFRARLRCFFDLIKAYLGLYIYRQIQRQGLGFKGTDGNGIDYQTSVYFCVAL